MEHLFVPISRQRQPESPTAPEHLLSSYMMGNQLRMFLVLSIYETRGGDDYTSMQLFTLARLLAATKT